MIKWNEIPSEAQNLIETEFKKILSKDSFKELMKELKSNKVSKVFYNERGIISENKKGEFFSYDGFNNNFSLEEFNIGFDLDKDGNIQKCLIAYDKEIDHFFVQDISVFEKYFKDIFIKKYTTK